MSLFVVQFSLQPDQLPGFVRPLMGLTALLLPFPFMVVQAVAMPLAVQLNVLVLGLQKKNQTCNSILLDIKHSKCTDLVWCRNLQFPVPSKFTTQDDV